MQCSELLETRPSVFQTIFPLNNKSNACDDIIGTMVSHSQDFRAFLSSVNPDSPRVRGQRPLPRSPHVPRELKSGSQSISVPADQTCNLSQSALPGLGTMVPTFIMLCFVVFLHLPIASPEENPGKNTRLPFTGAPDF